jgi:prephenate dehydratase
MRVAYQGEPGAYSESAALEHYGSDIETVPVNSFEGVFQTVESRECEAGLIPIENSLAGSIHQNYDLLLQHDLYVIGEHLLPIHHCLIACPGADLVGIRKVISHPQALAQCDRYLHTLQEVLIEPVYNTAGGVKIISQRGDPSLATVASQRAAELYGMAILAEGIEDHPENITRFLVIGCLPASPKGEAKTSIVFSLENQPGSLFKALSVFALRNIDLTKIESRPMIGKPWEYIFYVDFIGSISDPACDRALGNLEEFTPMMRVLGSYPLHRWEEVYFFK